MHYVRSIRRLALGAALAGAAIGLVPSMASANKQPTCTYDDGKRQVNLFDKSDAFHLHLVRDGIKIAARNENGSNTTTVNCFSLTGSGLTATVLNTDRIVVNGTLTGIGSGGCPTCDPVSTDDGYVIDEGGGAFAPGFTTEADGTSEIEILFAVARDSSGNGPKLEINGTSAADAIRVGGPGAVNFGNDRDIDVVLQSGAKDVTVNGGAGADFITGEGNDNDVALGRTTRRLFIDGGSGNDSLFGGQGRDEIGGGIDGDDYIQSPDSAADIVRGGPGLDAGITDVLDTVTSLESNVVMPIGTLRLSPRTVRTRAGKPARLSMSWTHPTAWRELRSVELQLYDGSNKRVGSVMARPRGLSSRGRVKVMARSRVSHHDKTVSARLALRLPRSLAGQHVRVAVQATDRLGHMQVEPDAGLIRVAK